MSEASPASFSRRNIAPASVGLRPAPTKNASSSSQLWPAEPVRNPLDGQGVHRTPAIARRSSSRRRRSPRTAASLDGDRAKAAIARGSRLCLSQRKRELKSDHRIRIVGQGQHLGNTAGSHRAGFRQANGLLADPRLGIVQAQRDRLADRGHPDSRESRAHAAAPGHWAFLDHRSKRPTTERSWRSKSSRWAVSRHQASGSARPHQLRRRRVAQVRPGRRGVPA